MGRYGNNIRRIAQTDELNERIRQAEQRLNILDKAAIPGARAIAYPSGSVQNGSPGATNPDKNGSPDEDNTTSKSPIDKAGLDDNTTDGDDLLTGDKVLQKGEDPGAIALKDCESGEAIDVRFNTGANEGEAKFKHPDGWSTTGPQLDPSYTEGRVWSLFASPNNYYSNNFDGLISAYQSGGGWTYCYTIVGGLVAKLSPDAGDALIQFTNTVRTIGQAPVGGVQYAFQAYAAATGVGPSKYGQQDCGLDAPDDAAACSADPPTVYDNWQEQDPSYKHQLAFSAQDGGFVSSSWDEGLPAKFRNDVGSGKGLNNIQLCTNDGEEVVISALRDGTFAYFKEDGFGFPEADAKIFHFDSSGKYLDTIREDEYEDLRSTNNPAA